jgi:hypothetical protein
MRNQTMYRTCLLAAALLLAGCSEPNHVPVPVARDPLAVGTEVFLTQRVVKHLNDIVDATHTIFPHVERHPDFVVGTKVRIFEVGPQSAPAPLGTRRDARRPV